MAKLQSEMGFIPTAPAFLGVVCPRAREALGSEMNVSTLFCQQASAFLMARGATTEIIGQVRCSKNDHTVVCSITKQAVSAPGLNTRAANHLRFHP
jgi:hypothetical protein